MWNYVLDNDLFNATCNNSGLNFTFSILPSLNTFSSGSMLKATLRNVLSKNGTRASRPHAMVDLLARKQSEV